MITLTYLDPLSSRITFSLYDEAAFDANLALSQGEEHTRMWSTEMCLQGTASYDVNMLNVMLHGMRVLSSVDNLHEPEGQKLAQNCLFMRSSWGSQGK